MLSVSMVNAVTEALAVDGGPVTARDGGTVELALSYAREIDEGGELFRLGPPLLAALGALLLTPAARAAALRTGKRPDDAGTSPLDELRRKRAERAAGAG
jgi:hypothetical protein